MVGPGLHTHSHGASWLTLASPPGSVYCAAQARCRAGSQECWSWQGGGRDSSTQPSDVNMAPLDSPRSPGMSVWPVTDPAAAGPETQTWLSLAARTRTTMALGDITGYSHQAVLTTLESPVSPPRCSYFFLLLFILHGSLAHLSGASGLWVSGDVSGMTCPPGSCGSNWGLTTTCILVLLVQRSFCS